METKTIYIAFDGREFEDDTECYEYEMDKQLLNVHNDLIMRDADGNEIGMNQFGECYYLTCKTKAAAEVVWDWGYEYQGYDTPWYSKIGAKPGNYFYDTNTEKWYDVDEEIKKLEERLNFLKKVKETKNAN